MLPPFPRMNQLTHLEFTSDRPFASAYWRRAWWQWFVLILLMAWLYYSILFHLALQWGEDPNFSHGFLVPVFAIFVLWRERSRLFSLPLRPCSWGLLLMAFSLAMLVVGVLGAELFLARLSLLLLIAGVVVVCFGASHLRAALFPLCFLFLMIPIPAIVFNQITFPLQILASKVAGASLPWLGVPALREGNIINLPAMSLQVAEACSGIRSLLSLVTLAAIYGYLIISKNWMRIALVLAAVPIAIVANSLRIVVTGLLVQYWSPEKAEGFFHIFSGWLVFLVSIGMLCALHQILACGYLERRRRRAFQL